MALMELTVKQLMNLGLWDKVCEYKGWNTWILNEGQIDENDLVEFDDAFEKEEVITLVTYEELNDLRESLPYMGGDSWFTTNTPRLIETIQHYEDVLSELKEEYEPMAEWHGHDGRDARVIIDILDKFKIR